MSQTTLAAAIAAWGLLCFGLGRWCRSLAFVLVAAAPALAIVPVELVATDHFDSAYIEHVYCDKTGNVKFIQLVLCDWDRHREMHVIQAWRMVNSCVVPDRPRLRPERDHANRRYTWLFQDGEAVRRVTATSFEERWSPFDSEVDQKALFPDDQRRGLSHPTAARPR